MNSLETYIRLGKRVLLVGPPGIGKTARWLAAAKPNKRRVVTMMAGLSERIDFGGCLVPCPQEGVTKALPLELLRELQTTKELILLFLDDLGRAPTDVQAALLHLFEPGYLSPTVLICGATNRVADKAGVFPMVEPLRSRFHMAFSIATPDNPVQKPGEPTLLSSWEQELEGWTNWAIDQNSPPEIIAWHRSTDGRTLYRWKPHADPAARMSDYRNWETVIDLWKNNIRDYHSLSATIGPADAQEFLSFVMLQSKITTPDMVRADPDNAPIPEEPQVLYLTTTMLANVAKPADAKPFIRYMTRLPRSFIALLARHMMRKMGDKLSANPDWVKWFTLPENQDLFTVN